MVYAHTKRDPATGEPLPEENWQPLRVHLQNVAELARGFGNRFACGEYAFLCGLYHDIGKYSQRFQKRLREGGHPVDHSTAGAKEMDKALPTVGFWLAYCVAGHHAGLPDGGRPADTPDDPTLHGRLKKQPEPYGRFHDEKGQAAELPKAGVPLRPLGKVGFSVSFFIRMLFSCLVDADFLDTERAMAGDRGRYAGGDMHALEQKLDGHLRAFSNPVNEINQRRTAILNRCIRKAEGERGLYTLTVPTGGGKTISSLAFAVKHAVKHRLSRVIYVIPYNSIIEQNVAVFRTILGGENVLEHHSNIDYTDTEENPDPKRLAAENWDMPVIVTTTVQFFESLFANKPSKCRKLHNIANSVVIFDEAQMLPIPCLLPCVRAIAELVQNYGCTAVLCSATQPALGEFFPKSEALAAAELCESGQQQAAVFKRTRFVMAGELSDEGLAERLGAENQVLCIVSTRKQAQNVFEKCKGEGRYHLSTLMYPQHRKQVLAEIRRRLKDGLPCRVVSTSLIEAGVDVDFPVVYRGEAGLDSEIQAAGRCNREGKRGVSPVYIFESPDYRKYLPPMLKRPMQTARAVAAQFDDIASPEAVAAYFKQLYHFEGEGLDSGRIVEKFETGAKDDWSFPFATVGKQFHLIENATRAVVIPRTDEARALVKRLRSGERNKELLRAVQPYTVSVYPGHYDALYGAGIIEPLDEALAVLTDASKYSDQTGLEARADSGVGVYI